MGLHNKMYLFYSGTSNESSLYDSLTASPSICKIVVPTKIGYDATNHTTFSAHGGVVNEPIYL